MIITTAIIVVINLVVIIIIMKVRPIFKFYQGFIKVISNCLAITEVALYNSSRDNSVVVVTTKSF